MKKRMIALGMVCCVALSGCGGKEKDNALERTSSSEVQTAEKEETSSAQKDTSEVQASSAQDTTTSETQKDSEETGKADAEESTEMQEKIKSEVAQAISSADSLQNELKQVDELCKKYEKLLQEEDGSQTDLNEKAKNVYEVWDAELNDLWQRMKSSMEVDVMRDLMAEQRRWVKNKETVVEETLSEYKEGSIYPMLYHAEMAGITKNRVYQLAFLFAGQKGESFEMPERSQIGKYIDDQGTGDVYSSLIIKEGMEAGTILATLSVHRLTQTEGTIKKKGDILIFKSSEYGMTGKITYGWDGAVFKVTKVKNADSPFKVGDVFEFPTSF